MRNTVDWLSQGVEVLIERLSSSPPIHPASVEVSTATDFDVLVIGSGYGGAVAAARFSQTQNAHGKPLHVGVLERGKEYVPGTFPAQLADLPVHVRLNTPAQAAPGGNPEGLFNFHLNQDVSVLVGNGLGGGSLINASVVEAAHPEVFKDPRWPQALRAPEVLEPHYQTARQMLQANALPDHLRFPKTLALQAMQTDMASRASESKPAPVFKLPQLAIHFTAGKSTAGIAQEACIACGDCVTGCNYAAKNTLPMNYLGLAKQYGAEIFTGATVHHLTKIERNGETHWRIWFHLTASFGKPHLHTFFFVTANHVVVSAGTLGSTEILLRSRAAGLPLSPALGSHFSANGDMLSAGYDLPMEVKPTAKAWEKPEMRGVGPTITAMLDGRAHGGTVVEEGAVPAALATLFAELVTTAHLPYRLTQRDRSNFSDALADPAAVKPAAMHSTQVFLGMGRDAAEGRLTLETEPVNGDLDSEVERLKESAIRIRWPRAAEQDLAYQQMAQLDEAVAKLGGTHLTNPMWRALPDDLSNALSGRKQEKTLLSVHPLGGCPMSDTPQQGVVDDLGRVYQDPTRGAAHALHEGLYVLDGSIVPTSLGINPLLTITAISERAVLGIARQYGWQMGLQAHTAKHTALTAIPVVPPNIPASEPRHTDIRFSETMSGWLTLTGQPLGKRQRVYARLNVTFLQDTPLEDWLADPARHVRFTAESADAAWQAQHGLADFPPTAQRYNRLTLTWGKQARQTIPLDGTVHWLVPEPSSAFFRSIKVLYTFFRLRGVADYFIRRRERKHPVFGHLAPEQSLVSFFRNIWKLASHTGAERQLRYHTQTFTPTHPALPAALYLHGVKRVRYAKGNNLWNSLGELATTLHTPDGTVWAKGTLSIDWPKLVKSPGGMQVENHQNAAHMWEDLIRMGGFMARAIVPIHFWSFRLPEYAPHQEGPPLPGPLPKLTMPERYSISIPAKEGASVDIVLTRYQADVQHTQTGSPQAMEPPIVLLHGFGASGYQFAVETLKDSAGDPSALAPFLALHGRDVWVVELRTSIALPSSARQWSVDEVAQNDIPAALRKVIEITGHPQVDVIAHCIGSAMFCIATLSGKLTLDGKSLVRRAVLSQVGPEFIVSPANRFRAYAANLVDDALAMNGMNNSVDERATQADNLLDRALAIYPFTSRDHDSLARGCVIDAKLDAANYIRSSGIFSPLFHLDTVDPATRLKMGDLLGFTNLRLFKQLAMSGLHGRLLNQHGASVYVTDAAIRDHMTFPILFTHGLDNQVFSVETSLQSCARLRAIHGNTAAQTLLLPDFGHLDTLIGRTAATEVFPKWLAHLSGTAKHAVPTAPPVLALQQRAPVLGPVLGWTRLETVTIGQQSLVRPVARVWVKIDRKGTSAKEVRSMVLPSTARASDQPTSALRHRIHTSQRLQYAVFDVPLPPLVQGMTPDGVEIRVWSVHGDVPPVTYSGFLKNGHAIPDAAWITETAPAENPRAPRYQSLHITSEAIQSLATQDTLCFAAASCRYSGSPIERTLGDAMLGQLRGSLNATTEPAWQPQMMLWMGDQMYADANGDLFDSNSYWTSLANHYQVAYEAPHARQLLRALPNYMMLDDHEIANDWNPALRVLEKERKRARAARYAFAVHQWSHAPHQGLAQRGAWYHMDHGGLPFFVMDTRLEREAPEVGSQATWHIMRQTQLDAIEAWLTAQCAIDAANSADSARPKFIVSPTAMFPMEKHLHQQPSYATRGDDWDAYPESLAQLLRMIARLAAHNVVILAGDLHCSSVGKVTVQTPDFAPITLWSVVSSPLYAPWPFANFDRLEAFPDGAPAQTQTWSHQSTTGSVTTQYSNQWLGHGDSVALLRAHRDMQTGWHLDARFLRQKEATMDVSVF